MDRLGGLVVIAPARRAVDPGSIPGPGENFSLKLLTKENSWQNKNKLKKKPTNQRILRYQTY